MVKRSLLLGLLMLGLATSGCGLEGFFYDWGAGENVLDQTVVRGTIDPPLATIQIIQPNGDTVSPTNLVVSGGVYEIALPSTNYSKLRLNAVEGDRILSRFLPTLTPNSVTEDADLDAQSMTTTLLLEARMSADFQNLQTVGETELAGAIQELQGRFDQSGPVEELRAMIARLVSAGGTEGPAMFQSPRLNNVFETEVSAINPAWFAGVSVDYTGDGTVDTSTITFNEKLAEAAQEVGIPVCFDPDRIRVVLEVDFNAGRLDGNCDPISRFKWVRDEPNKSMFFVGGIHMESPIQDPAIDASMGNTGGWVPNTIPMYDDGTNGDEQAGDNIWTISYILPRGLRIGYKYTWGTQGALWTGSEEWPGNQHILEIVDVNGDNYVRRRDNFGDEATNKDRSNLKRCGTCNGQVTWDTDRNMDGIPDAQERPLDFDFDCVLDDWATPTGIAPATVECTE